MDREEFIAALLLRGFTRSNASNDEREMYVKDDIAVLLRDKHTIVGITTKSPKDALGFADLMTMTGDQDEQPIAGTD